MPLWNIIIFTDHTKGFSGLEAKCEFPQLVQKAKKGEGGRGIRLEPMLQKPPRYRIPLDILSMRLPMFITTRKCKDREVHPKIASHSHHLKPHKISHAFPHRISSNWSCRATDSPISFTASTQREVRGGNPRALSWRLPQSGPRSTTVNSPACSTDRVSYHSKSMELMFSQFFTFINMLILVKLPSAGIQHCKI